MPMWVRYVADETPSADAPMTPLEQLRRWCEEQFVMMPWSEHTEQQTLAAIRGRGRELGVMCSPSIEDVDGRLTLVINPWADQPLLWDGDGA